MKKVILFSLVSILLMSCGHYADGTSVWSGGLFIIPWLTGIGSAIFFVIAFLKSKSGSEQQLPGGGYIQSKENVPIYKIGQFYFACALLVATVVIILMVNGDK